LIYRTSIPLEKQNAIERFKYLIGKEKRIELTEKKKKRSIAQNSYEHLLFNYFGLHFGYTLQEVKQNIFKKVVNPDIFYEGEEEYFGEKVEKWRSTADLKTDENSLAISRFLDFSAQQGFPLPEPKDLVWLETIENELSKHTSKQYL